MAENKPKDKYFAAAVKFNGSYTSKQSDATEVGLVVYDHGEEINNIKINLTRNRKVMAFVLCNFIKRNIQAEEKPVLVVLSAGREYPVIRDLTKLCNGADPFKYCVDIKTLAAVRLCVDHCRLTKERLHDWLPESPPPDPYNVLTAARRHGGLFWNLK